MLLSIVSGFRQNRTSAVILIELNRLADHNFAALEFLGFCVNGCCSQRSDIRELGSKSAV